MKKLKKLFELWTSYDFPGVNEFIDIIEMEDIDIDIDYDTLIENFYDKLYFKKTIKLKNKNNEKDKIKINIDFKKTILDF